MPQEALFDERLEPIEIGIGDFLGRLERAAAAEDSKPRKEALLVRRQQVTPLGAVLAGDAPGRPGPEAVTLFDSTGLAIQDLAVAAAAFATWRDGRVEAQTVRL